jgi:hypothetical protein
LPEEAEYEEPLVQTADITEPAAAEQAQELSGDGETVYPECKLAESIERHYRILRRTFPEYTDRIDEDEFGTRYLAQIRRETEARELALEKDQELAKQDAAHLQRYKRGTLGKKLVAEWIKTLTEAIEEEQNQVGTIGIPSLAGLQMSS